MASFVVLEGDFRAGYFDSAGLRLGDFLDGDLRKLVRVGGEVFLGLAGERGGDTPLRFLGGLASIKDDRIRPLLVVIAEINTRRVSKPPFD